MDICKVIGCFPEEQKRCRKRKCGLKDQVFGDRVNRPSMHSCIVEMF